METDVSATVGVAPRAHESWWEKRATRNFLNRWDGQRKKMFAYVANMIHKGTILDAGGGTGKLYPFLYEKATEYTIIDITPKFIGWLKKDYPRVNAVRGSITDMSMFEDKQFDTAVVIAVIEHLNPSDMPIAIKELMRVSNRLIISWFRPPWNNKTSTMKKGWLSTQYNKQEVKDAIGKTFTEHRVSRYGIYDI